MIDATTHIRRETRVSIVINAVLSVLFFLLVFGWNGPVRVWGVGNYVFDAIPQSFMVSLMSTLVPGAMTARKLAQASVAPIDRQRRLPRSLIPRGLIFALAGSCAGYALFAVPLLVTGVETLAWGTAFAFKIVYGGTLGALVSRAGLREALSR